MATGKITLSAVKAMVKTERTEFLWDSDLAGFGLRMTANGAKSYIYQYRMGGREAVKKRHTIGKHGSPWTPDTARTEAKRLALMVGQGIDPALADKERRRQAVDLAFSAYVTAFVDGYLKTRWKDWALGESMLKRHAMPILKGTPVPTIKRSHIAEVLDRLADRPASAKLMHATLRKLFNWSVNRGDIERSPMEGMEAPEGAQARERVLNDDELTEAWKATKKLNPTFGALFRLLMITGQRREEVTGLDWAELDRASATWTLPSSRAKNDKAHIVPLSDLAITEIDEIARKLAPDAEEIKWPKAGLLFTTTGTTVVSGHSKAKLRLDAEINAARAERAEKAGEETHQPMPQWRLHDLRRTFATGMQRLGIRFEVTEAALNHISGSRSGVAGVYQRHDWKEEKRVALDAWARHISAALAPSDDTNVAKLKRRVAA